MSFYLCRECGSEFENDTEQGGAERCPECDSRDILPLKTNSGFIEQDSEGRYTLDLVDSSELEDEEEKNDEPGSLFDRRRTIEEEDCE